MTRLVCIAVLWVGWLGSAVGQEKAAPKSPPPDLPPTTILEPGEYPIDLGSALRLAGAQNPELLLARQRVTEAIAVRQLAAAQLLPNINGGTSLDLHTGPLQQSRGDIIKVNRGSLYVGLGAYAVGAGTVTVPGISYNLNIGQSWFAALQARQAVARRVADSAAADLDIGLRVSLSHADLLRAESRRAVALRNRADVAEVARLTAAYAAAGQGRKADADRAAVELRRRDLELLQAEADMLTASARHAQNLNLDPSTRLKTIDGYAVPEAIVPDPIPLAELIAIALMQRPELESRRAQIRESMYALSGAKLLPFSPTVILGFSTGNFGGGSNLVAQGVPQANGTVQSGPRFGDYDGRNDFDVVAYWTLQNLGVGNVARIRIAASQVRQSEYRLLETLNRIRTEVAESHARSKARLSQIDVLERAVRSATEAFTQDLARIRQREGLPIEVLDSIRLLSRARNEYLDAIIDFNRAQFQLYAALGRPPVGALVRPVPAELVEGPQAELLPAPRPAEDGVKK